MPKPIKTPPPSRPSGSPWTTEQAFEVELHNAWMRVRNALSAWQEADAALNEATDDTRSDALCGWKKSRRELDQREASYYRLVDAREVYLTDTANPTPQHEGV